VATRKPRDPVDEVLLSAVRWAMAISVRAADELGDLSAVQLRALTILPDNARGNLNGLAAAMGVTVSTASRLVDRLVAAGLVDRRPSPQTRREISLSLTPARRGRLQRYDRLRIVEARTRLEAVPPDRRDSVLAALEQLVGDGAGPAPSQG
jgi:DNA-binding MarR family transcriptional regulator